MYYFVVNPVSGCGKGKKIWNTIKKELDQLSVEYEAFLLREKGEARDVAASLSKLSQPFTLVVVGGDGTLNEVIGGLSSFINVTLGCIPTGSGNDFVRGLKLEKDPLTVFCRLCRKLGYELYEMDLVSVGEDFYATMRRSTNGGGENSPKLEGEDDFYELLMASLEAAEKAE